MTPGRIKSLSLLAAAILGGVGLLAWAMPWSIVVLKGVDAAHEAIGVTGETAAPALSALSLAGLALVAALAIAGPFFRFVLGVLESLLGVCIVWSALAAITDPVAAASPLITAATGISGSQSIAALVASATVTAWPFVALVGGALMIVLGIVIVVTARSWPGSSRKYQAVRFENADEPRSAVSDWDTLSDGDDPTGDHPTR